ncbi:MAG TPA: FkbM family methyltransferase [Phycisphaerales bacterium]|nr:FkbM family methyltransferase [Phycisphaerales bacterium]
MKTSSTFAEIEKEFFQRLTRCGWSASAVIDVGGSNGAWSRTLADVLPDCRFDLFEPLASRDPEYATILKNLCDDQTQFILHEVALGATAGTQQFWKQPWAVGSSLLARNAPPDEIIEVSVARLDDYREQHGIPQPQLIKIDVQGGELLVLEGGRQTAALADALHIETWLGRGYGKQTPLLPDVMDFLRPLDHVLVQLGEYWRKPDQELFVVDAFFVHRRLIDQIASAGCEYPWPQNWTPDA